MLHGANAAWFCHAVPRAVRRCACARAGVSAEVRVGASRVSACVGARRVPVRGGVAVAGREGSIEGAPVIPVQRGSLGAAL